MNRELQYPSRETICRLTKELDLEGANEYTQDWECEVANMNQLPKYINYYKTKQLNINDSNFPYLKRDSYLDNSIFQLIKYDLCHYSL